jgi:hypothetical protein
MKRGQSMEVKSRESQRDGANERRDGVAERRFFRTRSRWPRAMERDWGGLRRKILVVRPRRMAFSRVVLEVEPRERETYVVKEASLMLEMGGTVGLMERAEMSGEGVGTWGWWERVYRVSGGWGGGGGGMWSRYTFSLARLEPTRTGVRSPGAKMESVVGVRRQEPEA